MAAASKRVVVDASIVMAWCFDDERTEFTDEILDLVSAGAEIVVPAIWPLEIANALLTAERRKRISMAQTIVFLGRVARFSISVETMPLSNAFGEILSLARQHDLTEYDAAYAELALHFDLPLATLDAKLRRAAKAAGIRLFSL